MKAYLFAIVVSLPALGFSQTDWVQVTESNSGAKGYTNFDRLKREPFGKNVFNAWWRIRPATPQTIGGKKYSYNLSNYRVDCENMTLAMQSIYFYDASGSVVMQDTIPDTPKPLVPDTSGETFANAICSAAKIRGL